MISNMGIQNFIKDYNYIVEYINDAYNKKYELATESLTVKHLRIQYNNILKFVEWDNEMTLDNTWGDFRNSVSMMRGFLGECEFCKEQNVKLYDLDKNELKLI